MEKNEYEIQHFGFSATQISLERKHVLEKILSSALDAVLAEVLTYTKSASTGDLLAQQRQAVHSSVLASFGGALQELEALDRKNFAIPAHVLLPADFEHLKQYTALDERQLDNELTELKQHFLENSAMIASLKTENEKYESLQRLLQQELEVHALVRATLNAVDMKKIRHLVESTVRLQRRSSNLAD